MKRIKLIELIKEIIQEENNKITIPIETLNVDKTFNENVEGIITKTATGGIRSSTTGEDKNKINKGEYLPFPKQGNWQPIKTKDDLIKWKTEVMEKWKKEIDLPSNANIEEYKPKLEINTNIEPFKVQRFKLINVTSQDWIAQAIEDEEKQGIKRYLP